MRHFTYKSLDDIQRGADEVGADHVRFEADRSQVKQALGRKVRVGPVELGNSMCIHPMEGCDGTLDGRPDELTRRRYERFAAGGAKLIWGEATAVLEEGRANSRQLLINEQTAPDLERMLALCRQ